MDAEHRLNNSGVFIFVSDSDAAKAVFAQSPFPQACLCPGCRRQGAGSLTRGQPQGAALDRFLMVAFSICIPGFQVNMSFLGGKCSQLWSGSAKWLRSCPTLCDPMNCSLLNSSDCGILQARILEWVAMPSSRGTGYSPRDVIGTLIWSLREP